MQIECNYFQIKIIVSSLPAGGSDKNVLCIHLYTDLFFFFYLFSTISILRPSLVRGVNQAGERTSLFLFQFNTKSILGPHSVHVFPPKRRGLFYHKTSMSASFSIFMHFANDNKINIMHRKGLVNSRRRSCGKSETSQTKRCTWVQWNH